MKKDAKFVVAKAIPLNQGKSNIPVNSVLYRTHGAYYLDGGLLPPDYQQDFDMLVDKEETRGWNYLRPTAFTEFGL